jgi:biotin carboxyl carrier protein
MNKEKDQKKERFKSIVIDDTKYKTQLTTKYINRKAWEKPDETKVIAFIPGTIIKIFVKEKQKLKKGTRILVFEAMKMKNNVFIHRDGIIKKIYVKEGDKVPKGILMVELVPKV